MVCVAHHTPPVNPICVAVLKGAHGVRGQVRLEAYTQNPMNLKTYGALWTEGGAHFHLVSLRPVKGHQCVATLAEVEDRDQASLLGGVRLYVDRSALPDLEDANTFYHTDLVGLNARIADDVVGRVSNVQNFGGGDLLEITRTSDGQTVWMPFSQEAVLDVRIREGFVVLNDTVWQDMQTMTTGGGDGA